MTTCPVCGQRCTFVGGTVTHYTPTVGAAFDAALDASLDQCPDCDVPQSQHLTADECEARGIDTRDGRGCAVVTRSTPSWGERGPQTVEEYNA